MHTQTPPPPPHSFCEQIKFSKIMDFSMRTQGGGRKSEAGQEMGGWGEGKKRVKVSQNTPLYTPSFIHLVARRPEPNLTAIQFLKAKSNLCLSSAQWHTVTLEGFSHHQPFGAGRYDHWHCLPLLHRNTHTTMNRARKVKKWNKQISSWFMLKKNLSANRISGFYLPFYNIKKTKV